MAPPSHALDGLPATVTVVRCIRNMTRDIQCRVLTARQVENADLNLADWMNERFLQGRIPVLAT